MSRNPGDPFTTKDHGTIVCVEYTKIGRSWRPHSIITTAAEWDADWSKAHGCLLVHNSGSGTHLDGTHEFGKLCHDGHEPPFMRFWMSSKLSAVTYRKGKPGGVPVTDGQLRRMGYQRLDDLPGDPFEDASEVDGHIEYCEICDDYFDDENNHPCPHMEWSDDCNMVVGPGAGDSEALDAVEESIARLCEKLGLVTVEDLREAIASLKFWESYGSLGEALDEIDPEPRDYGGEGYECARIWLDMLDKSKALRPAVMQTIAWLDAWLDKAEAAR